MAFSELSSWWHHSPSRRWILYFFCFVTVSTVAGVVYGWPALRKQLKQDGSTLDESTLGAVFTVGAWSTQGGRFFVGLARDRFGTNRVSAFCTFLVTLGFVGIAWSDPNNAIALGFSLFASGLGSGSQLCVQPVAGLFPNTSGTVIASLSGAFQISGLVFLALTSGDNEGARKVRFASFSILLLVVGVSSIILLPKGKSFLIDDNNTDKNSGTEKSGPKDIARTTREASSVHDSGDVIQHERNDTTEQNNLNGSHPVDEKAIKPPKNDVEDDCEPTSQNSDDAEAQSASVDPATPPTVWEQLKTAEYICLCIWFSICLIPLQYYVGSIGFILESKGDTDGFYTDLFSIVYASATVVSPAGGFLSDRLSLGITQGLATVMCAASFFLLASDVTMEVQSIGLVLYGVGRLLVFGMYFANCGSRFGYANFGTLAGLGLLTSALASLLQYPMISAAANGQAKAVNLASGALLLAQLPYFWWLHRREKTVPGAQK